MFAPTRSVALAAAALLLAGCASLPPDRGYAETRELIARQRAVPEDWAPNTRSAYTAGDAPLFKEEAVRAAFFNNASLRQEFARLGFGRAELEDARRIANPRFGYLRLSPEHGGGSQITRSLSLGLTDLLLLPMRSRLAKDELERLQLSVAAAALETASTVEAAWYEAVASAQIATMRELVANAARQSGELAQRFFDAGNINRLQLEQERAAASQAGIDATAARADALRAHHALAKAMGVSAGSGWSLPTLLPAPHRTDYSADRLVSLALESRLDLAAARKAVDTRERALGLTRRWRWLGDVEIGYERERETDGGLMRGPSLELGLPIFNQGQGDLARAQAELVQARAELDAALLAVSNDAQLGIEAVEVAREIAERYRAEIVPRREAIVARTQEQVNFMLVGVFELLLAKQEEYDAYQAYLEAVRDYWIARTELRAAVGGRLPDDGEPEQPTLGPDTLVPAAAPAPSMDHSQHSAEPADPHAAHRAGTAAGDADPHAGHRMRSPKPAQDPHAGHRSHRHEAHAGQEDAGMDADDSAHSHTHGDQP